MLKSQTVPKLVFAFTAKKLWVARVGLLVFVVLMFFNERVYAQNDTSHLLQIKSAADSSTRQNPAEKIYLQFDKSTYTPGDTLWFKAYLFNAPTLNLSAKSGLMYVSVVTDSNVVVKRLRLPAENGLSWGNISLKEMPAGTYTLVAYTQWLQNFNQDCFFKKRFTIADDAGSNWLANCSSSVIITDGKEQARVKLLLSDIYKTAVAGKQVQLVVMKGRRRLFKQAVQTDEKGLIDITFNIPDKPGDIHIVANDAGGNRVNIPLNFNRPQDADVQFMPEGGNLVAGFPAHIGLKAIGLDGKGIDVSGEVLDHDKQVVANFASQHLGIGSFILPLVKQGDKYTARVTLPGGGSRDYPLPDVKSEGTVLNITDVQSLDSLRISIAATSQFAAPDKYYYLIGKAREVVCYGAMVDFKNGALINQKISKRLFPSGITHFVLLDSKNRPVNERLVFINRHDNLRININTDKTTYATQDSIALHIGIKDALGNPVTGNFSLAVTDDALVHPDSVNNENIITRVLLTSELKGYVEQPGYYLGTNNAQSREALDNLLLTQGWVSYAWPDEKGRPVYTAETEVAIRGRVLNAFNKPVKATKISMLSKSPVLVAEVITDDAGRFVFKELPVTDTPAYLLKTVKNFNVSISMDDAPLPILKLAVAETEKPWYTSGDTSLFNGVNNNHVRQNLLDNLPAETHALKEVKITAKKIIKGSQNLNGTGEADLTFDEADMEKAGKQTWFSFLQERVPGFRVGIINKPSEKNETGTARYTALVYSLMEKDRDEAKAAAMTTPYPIILSMPKSITWYLVDNKPLRLIVDGVPVGSVFLNASIDHRISFNAITNYLQTHDGEDIKGMEIIYSGKYAGNYFRRYIPTYWQLTLNPGDFAFIELTTRSGHGPVIENTPGRFLYKPLALSLPASFYRPRYTVNEKNKHVTDLRSTIHWEPNITVGADGKAMVSFFASGKPSTYTYLLEGTNMDGSFGYITGQVKVTNSTNP